MKKSTKQHSTATRSENALLLREARKIVTALGKMFAPCCEVVLHDLTKPSHAIIEIEGALSGRSIGDATTEMGLARIADPSFPDVVQNYANVLPDGRVVKSTSIGIKNSQGKYIAAICLNLDISLFSSAFKVLEQFTATNETPCPIRETLRTRCNDDLSKTIKTFSAKYNMQPRTLNCEQRRELMKVLYEAGHLQLRGAMATIAKELGISRASVYNLMNMSIESE